MARKRKKIEPLAETVWESPQEMATPEKREKLIGDELARKQAVKSLSFISKMLATKTSPVDLQEIAYQFYEQIGGASGYVDLVMKEYNETQAGSLARTRVLQLMNRLFEMGAPKERLGETALLTEEDLAAAYFGQLQKAGLKVVEDVWIDHICI